MIQIQLFSSLKSSVASSVLDLRPLLVGLYGYKNALQYYMAWGLQRAVEDTEKWLAQTNKGLKEQNPFFSLIE